MLVIEHPKLNHVMSRGAKKLRDKVFTLCLENSGVGSKGQKIFDDFKQAIIDNYDPLDWERALLYASTDPLYDAVLRITSTRYVNQLKKDDNSKAAWEMGSTGGGRNKEIDWVDVAKFDAKWWYGHIRFPHSGSIQPNNFDKVIQEFSAVYKLFTDWFLADFGYHDLLFIWHLTNKNTIEEIQKCMDMVTDKNKRSTNYLSAILDKEDALLRVELEERQEMMDHSQNTLDAIASIVDKDRDPVDWNNIEKDIDLDRNNEDGFKGVKLS
jgi:hypothetical protein